MIRAWNRGGDIPLIPIRPINAPWRPGAASRTLEALTRQGFADASIRPCLTNAGIMRVLWELSPVTRDP